MKLSIIIPAHNEEERLPPVLEAYAEYFSSRMADDVEFWVIVNGSNDGTEAVAKTVAERYSQIQVIVDSRKIGKGGAIILGAKEAVGDRIGYVDADGSTTAEEFYRLYGEAQSVDGVIASRWMKGSEVTIPQKGLRLLSSRIFNLLIRGLLGLKFKDTQCGAKIFSADAWRKILPDIGITRFAFDVDMLFQLKRHGYKVLELPTVWCDVAGSKVNVLGSSFDMFCALVRMRLLHSPFRFIVNLYERFLSKPVEWLRHDDLFCHAMILFGAAMVANICNVAYQMVMTRALPELEYALLASFLAALTIVMRPLATVSTALSHYTSILVKEDQQGLIKRLLIKWCTRTFVASLLFSLIVIVFCRQIAGFLHLDRVAPVVVSGLTLPVIFIAPVWSGILYGLQRFGMVSMAGIVGAITRVMMGAVFVFVIFPASGWALAAHSLGMYATLLFCVVVLFAILGKAPRCKGGLPSLRGYILQSFPIQISMAFLMTGDVIVVKHYLPDESNFAYAATLARMVAFLAIPVVAAMFPKVSSRGRFTPEHKKVYARALLYCFCLVALSVLVCLFFSGFLHRVLFGITQPSQSLIALTRWMAMAMAMTTLANVNIMLLLAQRRFAAASIVCFAALLYLGGACVFHSSTLMIVHISIIANFITLVVTTAGVLRSVSSIDDGHEST